MPGIERRSVLELGSQKKSLAITLPQAWAKFWDIKKKQKLNILYDDVLIVFPPNYQKEENYRESFLKFPSTLYLSRNVRNRSTKK
ncbi:MAG: hypothetical protein QXI09_00180 [Candidatus Aenigmatarchaeota archaeon]